MDNYNWFLNADLSEYAGKWAVIVRNEIVEAGGNIKQILESAEKKFPREERVLVRVPKKETLMYDFLSSPKWIVLNSE